MNLVYTKLIVVVLSAIWLTGCVTATSTPAPQKSVASFDFTPPSSSPSGSAGMRIILVNPSFAANFAQSGVQPYTTFAESMGNDFQEILSSLGYTVYGPYRTYDEVVFGEKEAADLVILADIDMSQTSSLTTQRSLSFADMVSSSTNGGEGKYKVSGSLGIAGKLTLKAREPQSSEQMWTKSLEIVPQNFNVQSSGAWTPSAISSGAYMEDPGVYNPTADALKIVYEDAMGKVYTYLDPRELRLLMPQVRRIKDGIRY